MRDDQLHDLLHTLEDDRDPDPVFADALHHRLGLVARNEGRSRTPMLLLAAALLVAAVGAGLALGFGLVQLPNLVAEPSSSPSPSASAPAVAEPSPSGSAEPSESVEPSQSALPSASASPTEPAVGEFEPDSLVRIAADQLTVRAAAGLDAESLGFLEQGTTSLIVSGPVPADGYDWYLISALGLPPATGCGPGQATTEPFSCPDWFGWVASADLDGTPWLEAASTDCVEPPPGEFMELTVGKPALQLLHCYGGRELTFRAWWAGATGGAGNCDPATDLPWLGCPEPTLGWDEGYPEAIRVGVNPETGPTLPGAGQWVTVTAHMDDAEAIQCGSTADATTEDLESILRCRAQWVIRAMEPAPAP